MISNLELSASLWTADPEYQALRDEVVRAGLLKKTPLRHLGLFVVSILLIVLFFFFAASTTNLLLIAALAVLAAFLKAGRRADSIAALQKAIDLNPDFKAQGEYYIQEIQAGRNP
jgi:hypothetical protein